MAGRRRTLLFLCALGLGAALAPATIAAAGPTQDPGASFGGPGATTTTTAAVTTTEAAAATNQTLVESEDSPDQPLFTENRKVAAVIGGLILVALALLVLTIRYIRVTKPSSSSSVTGDPSIPMLPIDLDIHDDSIFVVDAIEPSPTRKAIDPTAPSPAADVPGAADASGPAVPEPAVPTAGAPAATIDVPATTIDAAAAAAVGTAATGTDHDAADADWEPHTDEHQRVEIPTGSTLTRPGAAARRKALGVDPG